MVSISYTTKYDGVLSSRWKKSCFFFLLLLLAPALAWSQATTSSSMTGTVRDDQGEPLTGATIQAKHLPSGTSYGVVSLDNGRYTIPAMRVGGPYQVTVAFIGFETREVEGITLRLGQSYV